MKNKNIENVKLGAFVLLGLFFVVFLLYMIGSNRNLFDSTILLRTRFQNIHGLMTGNNVRFAGIEVGTVKNIEILNDTTIEVHMIIKESMTNIIKKNALVSIGTEGFVGYKIINITNGPGASAHVENGDLLKPEVKPDMDDLITMVGNTIDQISTTATSLENVFNKVNQSEALWALTNDKTIALKIHNSLNKLNQTTANLSQAGKIIATMAGDLQSSDGLLHTVIYDTTLSDELTNTLLSFQHIQATVDSFEKKLSTHVDGISFKIQSGKGTIGKLMSDTLLVNKLDTGLDELVAASKNLNQNMEALKHNFLFRRYFKKLEKQKKSKP